MHWKPVDKGSKSRIINHWTDLIFGLIENMSTDETSSHGNLNKIHTRNAPPVHRILHYTELRSWHRNNLIRDPLRQLAGEYLIFQCAKRDFSSFQIDIYNSYKGRLSDPALAKMRP